MAETSGGIKYSTHKRNGIIYVQIYDKVKYRYGTAKSTGLTDKDKVADLIDEWAKKGCGILVFERENETMAAFSLLELASILDSIREKDLVSFDGIPQLIDAAYRFSLYVNKKVLDETKLRNQAVSMFSRVGVNIQDIPEELISLQKMTLRIKRASISAHK